MRLTVLESALAHVVDQLRLFLDTDQEAAQLSDLMMAEEQVTSFVRELGHTLLTQYLTTRSAQARRELPVCACGEAMTVHRMTTWSHKTLFGDHQVPDPYFYCRTCHCSARPLHRLLGTVRQAYSMGVQQAAVDLASDESCESAVLKLERHHPGVTFQRTSALRLLHSHGRAARRFLDQHLQSAQERILRPRAEQPAGATELEVEFDGGMIPVATFEPIAGPAGQAPQLTPVRKLPKKRRNSFWEEVKVGLVQVPGQTERLYAVRPTDGLDASFDDLFSLACLKGWTPRTSVRGIADGARHIRSRMEEAFNDCDFKFILDRPHAKQHLFDAGAALQPLTQTPAQDWAAAALDKLEVGDAQVVVKELHDAWVSSGTNVADRNDVLRREANYFGRNANAVAYAAYRQQGWSTASSEVESAHRHVVQQRLKIPGAWWRPDRVDDILALRMLKANGLWSAYWNARRTQWRQDAVARRTAPAVRRVA